jgi:hypothetical protein
MFRNFRILEKYVLQFRAEMTNFFNMVNLNNPNTTLSSSAVGTIRTADTMREVQLGLRFAF